MVWNPVEILDEHHVRFGGEVLDLTWPPLVQNHSDSAIVNRKSFEGYVYPNEDGWQVLFLGQFYECAWKMSVRDA